MKASKAGSQISQGRRSPSRYAGLTTKIVPALQFRNVTANATATSSSDKMAIPSACLTTELGQENLDDA